MLAGAAAVAAAVVVVVVAVGLVAPLPQLWGKGPAWVQPRNKEQAPQQLPLLLHPPSQPPQQSQRPLSPLRLLPLRLLLLLLLLALLRLEAQAPPPLHILQLPRPPGCVNLKSAKAQKRRLVSQWSTSGLRTGQF